MSTLISRRLVAVLALISVVSLSTPAQKPNPRPDEKPRKIKREIKKAYVDWIKDHDLILTQAERDAWKKLQTDDEREAFIADVWNSRDPDPDTEENEFKQQFYERVAYANEHFSSGIPGRLTDRGRIYIKFGKPDEIESHPTGGSFERPSWQGGGSTSTYPWEKWFYRYIPNVRSGIELEFVDPTGSGEFRLAKNPDEKDALITIPGAGRTFAEMAGLDNRANRITNLGGYGLANYSRAQDSPFEVMNLLVDLERDTPFTRNYLGNATDTPVVDDNPLNFETQVNYFRMSDDRVLAALTIQTNNDQLAFTDSGGLQIARMNIFGTVTSVANRRIGKFEESVTATATPAELSSARMRKSVYARTFVLEPGRYRVDVLLRDVESGAMGRQQVALIVPDYPNDRLSTSSLVLAAKLENVEQGVAVGPFNIGTTKVIPNLTGIFQRNEPVGIYLQVYNAGIDQTTLKPAADAEYVILKDGKVLSKQPEDWSRISDSGQRFILTRLIDTRALAPGEYEIRINVRDHVTGQSISPSAKFTIVP
jgi:GWxTD domain-containing protein